MTNGMEEHMETQVWIGIWI